MSCCKYSYSLCEPIPACLTTLIVKTPVISAEATLKFIDKFNRIYYVKKTTDASGNISITLIDDTPDLPLSLLNEYAGQFKLITYNAAGNIVPWIISGVSYNALIIEVKSIIPVVDTYTIDTTYAEGEIGQF